MSCLSEGKLLGNYCDSDTENGTVSGDERKEDTESLIKLRAYFLQYDLHHLHESGDDQDKRNRLEELQLERNQHEII